jgi:hypothetical protein
MALQIDMRIVCIRKLAGFALSTVFDCVKASCFFCGEAMKGVRDHLEIVHPSCSTFEWVFLVLRESD